ncbi:hypothetical protein L195_g036592 [Trifolium pratense]|uniref:Uncharacterized protein n=1 Tax=Trifolium pratense TaxID=57577 RepID=A0A2K3LPX8_TRIPR|nr:hypothetical protein L195_g036592 [Trifolium pratense]
MKGCLGFEKVNFLEKPRKSGGCFSQTFTKPSTLSTTKAYTKVILLAIMAVILSVTSIASVDEASALSPASPAIVVLLNVLLCCLRLFEVPHYLGSQDVKCINM